MILRRAVASWSTAEWTGGNSSREEAARLGTCHGAGSGFFEWEVGDESIDWLGDVCRISFLMEVSSRRADTPQTDAYKHASNFTLLVNGLPVLRTLLPDHPHDSRGALSFLRGGRGAYGYLIRSTVENELLREVVMRATAEGKLRIRTEVAGYPQGGLSVYDHDCGRFPLGPTAILHRAIR